MCPAPADKSARIMREHICALSLLRDDELQRKKLCPPFICVILMQMNIRYIHPRCWFQGIYCLVLIVSAEKRQVESAVTPRAASGVRGATADTRA